MILYLIQDFKKTFSKYWLIFKNLPKVLACHAFIFILAVIFLELMAGWWLFYYYVDLPKSQQIQVMDAPVDFKEKTYQSVLEEWKKRQAVIDHLTEEQYNNPF